jgi:hypothetical protein
MEEKDKQNFSDNELHAMRSYLQRSEVRLSTMHRIAGAFLSGAGLLFLFPIFFKDAFIVIINPLLHIFKNWQDYATIIKMMCLVVPVFISLRIPYKSLIYLLKDILQFYYKPHRIYFSEHQQDSIFHPRFALTGISFSADESSKVRIAVNEAQKKSSLKNFVIPFKDKEKQHIIKMVKDNEIYRLLSPNREKLYDENDSDWNCFLGTFGLAGVYDFSLVQEVAKMEASLVRHNICLRRLVLRYMKALLILVFTTFTSLLVASLLGTENKVGTENLLWEGIVISMFIYMVWSVYTPIFVKKPIEWVRLVSNILKESDEMQKDEELVAFEKEVILWCKYSLIASIIGLIIALIGFVLSSMNFIPK